MKPKILLLDEPLSALDGVIKESIKDRIRTIAKPVQPDDHHRNPRSGGGADAFRPSHDH